ncbi:uncharacterized protein LOC131950100 [Physella acuta]|uniref:uncharacterized protein LOC131950100 n=1 Tax=Physella acuta TaxID=109671 RepID=UPI0027DB46D9|nr:uncharacterized protein LOC131950100 [Physella acuta]
MKSLFSLWPWRTQASSKSSVVHEQTRDGDTQFLSRSSSMVDSTKLTYNPSNLFQIHSSKSTKMPGLIRLNSVGEISHESSDRLNFVPAYSYASHPTNMTSIQKKLVSSSSSPELLTGLSNLKRSPTFTTATEPKFFSLPRVQQSMHCSGALMKDQKNYPKGMAASFIDPFDNISPEFNHIFPIRLMGAYSIVGDCKKENSLGLNKLPSDSVKTMKVTSSDNDQKVNGEADSPPKQPENVDVHTVSIVENVIGDKEVCDNSEIVENVTLGSNSTSFSLCPDVVKSAEGTAKHCPHAQLVNKSDVLLMPRKVVKKGRPSSKKQKKRMRQKKKHANSSTPSVEKSYDNVNPSVKDSACQETNTLLSCENNHVHSTKAQVKESMQKKPAESNSVSIFFTLDSDSDNSDTSDCEDNSTDWSDEDSLTDAFAHTLQAFSAYMSDSCESTPAKKTSFSCIGVVLPDELHFQTGLCLDRLISKLPNKDLCLGYSEDDSGDSELLKEINAKWEKNYPSAGFRSCKRSCSTDIIQDPSIKVHFAAEPRLLTVHVVGSEDRGGIWQNYALDRERFQRRIQEASSIISPILGQLHRRKIVERNNLCGSPH